MADESSFLVQILLEARDNASAKVAALRAEIAALKREAEAGGSGGTSRAASRDLDDTGRAARDAERDVRGTRTEHERLRQSARSPEVREGARDVDALGAAAQRNEQNLRRARAATDDHRSAAARLGATLGDTGREADQSGEKVKGLSKRAEEAARSFELFDGAVKEGNVHAEDARRGYAQFAQELGGISKAYRSGSEDALRFARTAEEARSRSRDFGTVPEADIRRVTAAYKDFDNTVKQGSLSTSQVRRGYQDFASELGAIGRGFRAGSTEAERFLNMAEEAGSKAKKAGFLAPGDWNIENFLAKTSARLDSWGVQIVSLSANLRGLALVGLVGFAQQLDTAVVGLAGGLFSVASAAVQAGAALGGALVAGISQAIPVLGIVGAAVERLKTVFQAVQLSNQMASTERAQPHRIEAAHLQNALQIANAEHSLAQAYEGVTTSQEHVRSSQEALTLARISALRNIIDLTLAEKNAKLQAEGASISLTEAQRQLQAAIQTGQTATIESAQLAVKEAELNVQKSKVEVPRSEEEAARARRQGVEGAPSVMSAREAARQARTELANQRYQIEQAKQQLRLAQLQSTEPGLGEAQQGSQLKLLESQMSSPEKMLFKAMQRIDQMMQSPGSPIRKLSDAVIGPLAQGVERVLGLLSSPSAMKPLDELATVMAMSLQKIMDALTGSGATHFFAEMAHDAQENVPIVADSLTKLLEIFQAIARASAPFLHEIIEGFNKFVTQRSTPAGLDRIETFFQKAAQYARDFGDLAGAFGRLMIALGRDAAPTGGTIVNELTDSMNEATKWVDEHGPQVRNFFHETAEVLKQIGDLLFGLGGAMIKVFNPSSTAAFQQFLTEIILPALTRVLNILGWITTAILNIAKAIPGGTATLQIIAGIVATIFGIGKLYEPVLKVYTIMSALVAATKAFAAASGLERITAAWQAFTGTMEKAKTATEEVATAQAGLDTAEGAGAAAAGADAGAQGALDVAEAGGAATGAGGILSRLGGLGGAAAGGGILSKILSRLGGSALLAKIGKGGLAGLLAYFGAQGAGDIIGGNAGSQIGGGAGLGGVGAGVGMAVGGPLGAAVGFSAGELAHMVVSPDATGFSGKEVPKEIEAVNKALSSGDWEKAKKLAENLRLVSYEMEPSKAKQITKYLDALEGTGGALSQSAIATDQWSRKMQQYLKRLSPVAAEISESFKQMATSSGDILENMRGALNSTIKAIADDLGIHSNEGKRALIAAFGGMAVGIEESMHAGKISTAIGMQEIGKLVSEALKQYGINPSEINKYIAHTSAQARGVEEEAAKARKSGNPIMVLAPGYASGEYIPAKTGGVYRAAEGHHDEVVLTTDPTHAGRQAQLLDRYLKSAPSVMRAYASGGFIPDSGTNFSYGKEPEIVAALRKLAEYARVTIYGISGYRSPEHSVAVGGFANDAHTRGEAADIGWGSNSRESMRSVQESLLRKFDLYRPFWPASANEVNHVQLIPGGVLPAGVTATAGKTPKGGSSSGPMGTGSYEIEAPKAEGVKGSLRKVVQGALNKVAKAASQFIASQVGSLPGPAGGIGPGVFASVKGSGGSSSANEALGRRMMVAAGFGAGEWSDLQKLWTQESGWSANSVNPSSGAYGIPQALGHGHPYNLGDARAQIAWGLNYIRERYKTITAAWAHEVANNWYDRGGPIRKAVMAMGGMLAPWGGKPVEIVAHEGERVMNPMQYDEAARLAGTNAAGLDRHMGFDRGAPRQHFFADGGPVVIRQWAQPTSVGSSTSVNPSTFNLSEVNLATLGNNSYIVQVFKAVHNGFKALDKINVASAGFTGTVIPFINSITNEQTGLIARLSQAFTSMTSRLNAAAARADFKKVAGSSTLISSASPLQQTDRSLKNLAKERKNIEEQAKIIAEAEKQIRKRIQQLEHQRQTSKVKKELQQLVGAYNELVTAQISVEEQAQQNLEAAAQAAAQRVSDEVESINNSFGTEMAQLTSRQGAAQALGRYGELPAIDAAIANSARSKIGALEGALHDAEAIGNTSMVSQIKQEIYGLQQTVVSATAQMISDAEQLIQQNAGWYQSFATLYQTRAQVAAAQGQFGTEGAYASAGYRTEIYSDQYQLGEDRKLLAQAQAEGNTGQIYTLTEAINNLEGAISTNEQALKDNTAVITQAYVAQVTRQGQFSTGIYGGLIQLLQTAGQITGATNVAGEAELYKLSNKSLGETDQKLIGGPQGLNAFAKEYGITGIPNLEGLSGEALIKAIESMNIPAIESQMDPAQQQAFENIISALLQNTEQIETNNKELAILNGQLLQPQSFASAPWNQFRSAVFTGMGGLMPNIAASVGIPVAQNPAFTGAGVLPTAPTPTEVNVNVTSPTEVLDPHYTGHAIAWEMKNGD